jgi:hypothetical protein
MSTVFKFQNAIQIKQEHYFQLSYISYQTVVCTFFLISFTNSNIILDQNL